MNEPAGEPLYSVHKKVKPHKCPVCDGWGYRNTYVCHESMSVLLKEEKVTCTACAGAGILWIHEAAQ